MKRETRWNRTSRSCARDAGAAESMAGSCGLVLVALSYS